MGKILLNGVDYSAPKMSEVTGIKGNAENTYRKGNVNLTPANIGALSIDGNAVSATKAEQDGNGNNIADTYVKKADALTGDYLPLSGGTMNKSSQVSFNGDTGIDTGFKMAGSKFISYYHPAYIDFRNGNTGHEFDAAELRSDCLRLDGENNTCSTVCANGITVHDENAECIMKSDGVYVDGVKVGNVANSIRDPRSGLSNTLSYDGTVANPTYIAAWNDRFVEKYPMSSLDSKYAKTTHAHDDRYYTESEIDNLLKAQLTKIPSGLGSIVTGQFMFNTATDGNTGARNIDFYYTDSTYKRSMCILTSLYITAATTGSNTGNSFMREVAIHMVLHNDYDAEWHDTLKTAIYSKGSVADNVNITNKHNWQYQCDRTSVSDGRMTLRFKSPNFAACGAKFENATTYVSWAVIM